MGRSLKRAHCKGVLVSARKQATYKLSGTKSSLSSLKRVPRPLCKPNSPSGYRQHNSCSIHKQGRRHEFGPPVCPPVENLDLVFPETSDSKSPSYSGPAECDSRQTIQAGPDNTDGVVPPSGSFSKPMQEVAPASNRSLRHEIQPQTTSVCLPSSGLPSCGSGCSHSAMGGSGRLCLPTNCHLGQSGGEATGHPVQKVNSNCSGMAQHALVLRFSGHVQPSLPQLPNLLTQPFNQIPHRNLTNLNLHAWLLEPQQSKNRASLKQWQQELRLLREDQPDQSMRQSGPFLQSGASLIRWTSGHHL